ncbi:SGNH/GDSL hydrolase family protein [Paenibacillus sp. HB172176]|uniref:SGNH/GDSL hydrolase family protein n=1 Tax=Paenibacillus sp. HB172176 TaxID=2493690 RepID=UPI00143C1CFB|nr:SGNH/GDSL hydrolase family protein [Paenibacillus sp. HB172176]
MKALQLSEEWFAGVVSVEKRENGWKPWRIPYRDYELFPPDGLNGHGELCGGARLRFQTSSESIHLRCEQVQEEVKIDCMTDGRLFGTAIIEAGGSEASWTRLPSGGKIIELWLPQRAAMTITKVEIDDQATAELAPDHRPKWVAYGSSITLCGSSDSPTLTWPSIAARKADFNVTALGYGGNCHLEPMVARMIRDLPADLITLCLGINVQGKNSLGPRTFQAAIIGLIQIIREKHIGTPIIVTSPIYACERETSENLVGYSLIRMREEISEVVAMLQKRGDDNLHYRSGLDWFGEEDAHLLPDKLHPNTEGSRLMGERFQDCILQSVEVRGSNQ